MGRGGEGQEPVRGPTLLPPASHPLAPRLTLNAPPPPPPQNAPANFCRLLEEALELGTTADCADVFGYMESIVDVRASWGWGGVGG